MRILKILAVLTAVFGSAAASAAVVYDESVSGDLSSDNFNPTLIALANGDNQIVGSVVAAPGDRDFFTVTIGSGQSLTGVILEQFDTTEDQSFFAVQSGTQVTSLVDASVLLGNNLIGRDPGEQVGDDLLDDLGLAPFGGTGFSGALGAGTYTFWFQETAASVDYTFNLQVVPIPAAVWLLASALAGLAAFRRRV